MPSVFLAVLPVKVQGWVYLAPTIGQLFLINKVMRGEALRRNPAVINRCLTCIEWVDRVY